MDIKEVEIVYREVWTVSTEDGSVVRAKMPFPRGVEPDQWERTGHTVGKLGFAFVLKKEREA